MEKMTEIGNYVTLDNDVNYLVLEETVINSRRFVYCVRVLENEELTEEYTVFEQVYFEGDEYLQTLETNTFYNKLVRLFEQIIKIKIPLMDMLKNDRETVLAAVKRDGMALEYASEELCRDKQVVLAAVESDAMSLKYADESLKNDREVVLAAVNTFGGSLMYASEGLRCDKEVVMAAVSNYGFALEYADESLKNDKEVVLAAVKNDVGAIGYASEELRHDEAVEKAVAESSSSKRTK